MKFEKSAVVLLAAAAVWFLILSSSSLYVFPLVDGHWWYGDEIWLMGEWKSLLTTGRMVSPIGLGSTLTSSVGILIGSSWTGAVLYGVPQLLADRQIDVVHIGRTVTFTLALTTVFLFAWFGHRLRVSAYCILLPLVLLLSSKIFLLMSHSARYDVLTGLTLLAICGWFAIIARHDRLARDSHWFYYGAILAFLALTISPHLEVLLPPLYFYIAFHFGAFQSRRRTALLFAGSACSLVVLLIAYLAGVPSFSFFGPHAQGNQFYSVLNNIPILKPFSRSAQGHQLFVKAANFRYEAVAFFLVLPTIVASEIALRRKSIENRTRSFLFGCFVCVLFSFLFLQSTLPYYLVHLLPVASLAFMLQLNSWRTIKSFRLLAPALGIVAVGVLTFFETPELIQARGAGSIMTQNNGAGVQAAVEQIDRRFPKLVGRPLILAQGPALSELSRDNHVRVMSEAFLTFPERDEPLDSTIKRLGVDFVLDYDRPLSPAYNAMIQGLGRPVFRRTGYLNDRYVRYFTGDLGPPDTLSLYKVTR